MLDGKEFYNNMHRDHPGRWEVPNGGHHAFDLNVKEIVHEVASIRPIDILDLGCGTGRTLELLRKDNIKMWGIDYSEEAIKIATKRVPEAKFILGDMNHIETDGAWDIVLSIGSHEHQQVLDFSEPRRLVRKAGWFIAVFPCINTVSKGLTVAADGQHYDWDLNKEDWIKAVEKFGFTCVYYKEPWTFAFKPI